MRERARSLCLPHQAAVEAIARRELPVTEIGAGYGAWARALRRAGVIVRAFDLEPGGDGVEAGDHITAASIGSAAMLAVWPPDGREISRWMLARRWSVVFLCAHPRRISLGPAADAYRLVESISLGQGRKGLSEFMTYEQLTPA